jgi:hypothetical protein
MSEQQLKKLMSDFIKLNLIIKKSENEFLKNFISNFIKLIDLIIKKNRYEKEFLRYYIPIMQKQDIFINPEDNIKKVLTRSDIKKKIETESRGSSIAKGGYRAEVNLVSILNNDQKLIEKLIMISDLEKKNLKDNHLMTRKMDGNTKTDLFIINSHTDEKILNIQVKKVQSSSKNQVLRCWIDDNFKNISGLTDTSIEMLKARCYKIKRKKIKYFDTDDYSQEELDKFLIDFNKNRKKIINFAFLGIDSNYKPDIHCFYKNEGKDLYFVNTNELLLKLYEDEFFFTKKTKGKKPRGGNIKTSYISFQRKGGDKGRKPADQLQINLLPSNILLKWDKLFKDKKKFYKNYK